MNDRPRVSRDELGSIPLLRGFSEIQLDELIGLCEPAVLHGDVLFEAGTPAEALYLLTAGSVLLYQDGIETHTLHPNVVIGELGALTGHERICRAIVTEGSEVWQIRSQALKQLFERDKGIGLRFQQNLLEIVTNKIHCDQVRLQDMRANIIHTQKTMKRLREFLEESKDTVVSGHVHDVLEGLIARNRRVNYRVEPPPALAAALRMDDGTEAAVVQISRTEVIVQGTGGHEGDRISGVLYLSGPEVPISGRVIRIADGEVDIRLDLLIDEYAAELEGYLTRVQMLDLLV